MSTTEGIAFTLDKESNRLALASGVQNVNCIYAGPVDDAPISDGAIEQIYAPLLSLHDKYISSVEVYANGAVNAYVKVKGDKAAYGFIRYRE